MKVIEGPAAQGISPVSKQAAGADDMVLIPGGTVIMGSTRFYPEEAPLRQTMVEAFRIDRYPVTNRQFARFVEATGYVTLAQIAPKAEDFPGAPPEMLQPGSLVFHKAQRPVNPNDPSGWWRFVFGAYWSRPLGPHSDLQGLEEHPVIHIAYQDAQAYAQWAGKALPSEAQWEHAARGGLVDREYAWGDELAPGGFMMANYWQGTFPYDNSMLDGYERTSPVGSFPPNGYGLFDMIGNTWEWTCDWYLDAARQVTGASAKTCCAAPKVMRRVNEDESFDPAMPLIRIPRRVIKGGSHLCAENYCQRYRPAARHPQMIDSATSHLGFRCVSK
ncbi:TPA: formylglycine-generating enzyme family protein [Pseudomonas putida]|nr:formylglycine-generating enzyme family protein [Pseudomonas putida]